MTTQKTTSLLWIGLAGAVLLDTPSMVVLTLTVAARPVPARTPGRHRLRHLRLSALTPTTGPAATMAGLASILEEPGSKCAHLFAIAGPTAPSKTGQLRVEKAGRVTALAAYGERGRKTTTNGN